MAENFGVAGRGRFYVLVAGQPTIARLLPLCSFLSHPDLTRA
jgi:hypothetical protein